MNNKGRENIIKNNFESAYYRLARKIPTILLPNKIYEGRFRKEDFLAWLRKKFHLDYSQAKRLLKFCHKNGIVDYDLNCLVVVKKEVDR